MLIPVIGLIVLGIAGLVMLGIGYNRMGTTAVVVGVLAALIPVAPVVGTFLWIDRWEPEPARLLLFAFLWGACGATITSLAVNNAATGLAGTSVAAVISAPIIEETTKGLFVLVVLLRRPHEFDGVVDGVVYAGLTAAGFAFTENIFYMGTAFTQNGGIFAAFIARGLLSPFAHPLFTSMFGIGLGIATMTRDRRLRIAAPAAGFLAAIGLHMLWNLATRSGSEFITVYFLVMVPIFGLMCWLVVWQRRREQRVIASQLPAMARDGLIAPSEVSLLASLSGRKGWLEAVRRHAGEDVAKAVTEYQAAVTELAFLRHRIRYKTADIHASRRHDRLINNVIEARAAAVGKTDEQHG
ncbi:protease PrsW [Pseudonocardiaceae bacterium YIM PH 21723]|nr:protease PrsW [Pseudonocardiaceae bacterium YIM PH 21723]